MERNKKRHRYVIALAVAINLVLVAGVVVSVLTAFGEAEKASFSQNIENVHTLTDASANKIELEIMHHTEEIRSVSGYINKNDFNEEQVQQFFHSYFENHSEACSWQLANSESNGKAGSGFGFEAVSICNPENAGFTYKSQVYPHLAKILSSAGEETIGKVNYTDEFTDPSGSAFKVEAFTTTIRLREQDGIVYKTLMFLMQSDYINELISDNNDMDTLNNFDYSNIIINNEGEYVISNSRFQGTNLVDYIALYNDDFTKEDGKRIVEKLHAEDYTEVLFYKNNRGQDCAFTVVPVQNSEWHILSIVPLTSFHNAYDFNRSFVMFGVWFGLLFLADIVLILRINAKLRHSTKEAQAANHAKSEFLSSMSHDIRTPMNAIIGMTVIAEDALKEEKPDTDTLSDCISTIQLSGNHLLTLINDILDISKIENGKVALADADFSISESVSNMLEIMQSKISEKQLLLETHTSNLVHEFVHADELRINQIYINILSNAVKYTNPGGKITVDFSEEKVEGRPDVARYVYRVSDTGIGMDKEFLKTIFTRFSRAVDTRVNSTQGTGLGMAICKQLVDLMGGTITVDSALNIGSTFTVKLDLVTSDVKINDVSLEGTRVLLVDDDAILLETASRTLNKAGVDADVARSGKDGIAAVLASSENNKPYDVVLVDWKMDGLDGMSVIKALREKLGDAIRIIVMTAYSVADIESEGRSAGADAFITKPLFSTKLLYAIQSVFSQKQSGKDAGKNQKFDLSVLVAEDNSINWRVLEKILTRFGISADRAENGKLAVEALEKSQKKYDLVLMDIQMPVMNGYEATKLIRTLPDEEKSHITIYAMTADSFAEDVARCLDCGMDGHLAKPLEMPKLLKLLSQLDEDKRKKRQ